MRLVLGLILLRGGKGRRLLVDLLRGGWRASLVAVEPGSSWCGRQVRLGLGVCLVVGRKVVWLREVWRVGVESVVGVGRVGEGGGVIVGEVFGSLERTPPPAFLSLLQPTLGAWGRLGGRGGDACPPLGRAEPEGEGGRRGRRACIRVGSHKERMCGPTCHVGGRNVKRLHSQDVHGKIMQCLPLRKQLLVVLFHNRLVAPPFVVCNTLCVRSTEQEFVAVVAAGRVGVGVSGMGGGGWVG